MVRKSWLAAVTIATAALVAATAEAREMRMYNWADYTSPELLEKFKRETGITVVLDTFDNYEQLDTALRSGASGYDIAVPFEYHVKSLIQLGLAEQINAPTLAGFDNIEENWRGPQYDVANNHSIPWHWGTTSFQVDTDIHKGPMESLSLVFDPPPELQGKIGFLDEADEVVTLALRYLRLPRCNDNTDDLKKVEALLMRQKKVALYASGEAVDKLSTLNAAVIIAWNGDSMRARARKPSLRYAYPKEGVTVWTDALVIPKGARNKAEALEFMTFMLRPENAAMQSNFTNYANAIRGSEAFLDPALKNAPEIILPSTAKLEFLQACPASTYARYRQLWSGVKQHLGP